MLQLPALDHSVHRRGAHAEQLGNLGHGQERDPRPSDSVPGSAQRARALGERRRWVFPAVATPFTPHHRRTKTFAKPCNRL
jgi:hypothetical protein